MKLRVFIYGFFGLAACFAAWMGYLYWSADRTVQGQSVFERSEQGAAAAVEVPSGAKAQSGRAGRVILTYAGDLGGSIDPCPCTEPPTGGLKRRLTVLRDIRASHTDTPIMALETGQAFLHSDKLDNPVNKHMAQALNLVGVEAVRASAGDIRRLEKLKAMGWDTAELKGDYVATSIQPAPSLRFPVKPWSVRTVRAEKGGAEARVGVLALSENVGDISDIGAGVDFIPALRRHLPEVEARSDVVVLLTWAKDAQLIQLARQFPGIDVIINGSTSSEGREFEKVGSTVIVESARKGIGLGMLDLNFDARGRITASKNEIIPLASMIQDAQLVVNFALEAKKEYLAWKEEDARRQPPPTETRLYMPASACKACHAEAYAAWSKSGHARAIDSLKKDSKQFDEACLQCHATAFDVERGFLDVVRTPQLSSVQCDACHGSTLDHSKNPEKIHPGIGLLQQTRRKVKPEFCKRCHDPVNSPKFDFETYWQKIAH